MGSQATAITMQPASRPVKKLTPRQVLEWLPDDATPAQQDSAIRAHIKPEPITHWSDRPDTLHLPGHTPGGSCLEVALPQLYYKESFFARDSMFHSELRGGRLGVAGDPIPYTIAGDSLISGILVLCFLMSTLAISKLRHVVSQQIRRFLPIAAKGQTQLTETSEEFRFQVFFVLATCLMLALDYFLYFHISQKNTFTLPEYQVIGMYVGILVCYFSIKFILYTIVGAVFFNRRDNEQWLKSYLFLISLEGVLLFPAIMLTAYFFISQQVIEIYTLITVVFIKLLTIYKYKSIFFEKKGGFLQIILYFCALEVIPLLALMGTLNMVSHYLNINF